MIPASITRFNHSDQQWTEICISEVGEYLVPFEAMPRTIAPTALDVVNVKIDRHNRGFILQAESQIITNELFGDNTRLQVRPKMSFDDLDRLLAVASAGVVELKRSMPVPFATNRNVHELFAERFMIALRNVTRLGLAFASYEHIVSSRSLVGRIDPLETIRRVLSTGRIELVQTRRSVDYDLPANRVLATATLLVAVHKAFFRRDIYTEAVDHLNMLSACSPYATRAEALQEALRLVHAWRGDMARSYYLAALEAAIPILQMISRSVAGSTSVEGTPMRISLPEVVESAIRNVTTDALATLYWVGKGAGVQQYIAVSDYRFNREMFPDILVRNLGEARGPVLILDVKYKEKPSDADHYQMAAYLDGYGAAIGGFVCVGAENMNDGLLSWATARNGKRIFCYVIPSTDIVNGLRKYHHFCMSCGWKKAV